MTRPGTVVATRLVGIRFTLNDAGEPGGHGAGFEIVTFELEQDIADGAGGSAQARLEISPSNILDMGHALKAWTELTPLITRRFEPGGGAGG